MIGSVLRTEALTRPDRGLEARRGDDRPAGLPSARFQSRTSPSQLPEATVLPSGEMAKV